MAKDYRVLAGQATQEQLVAYLSKIQGLPNIQPNTSLEKLRAKVKELGIEDDDYINMPDDGEADREEARLSRQETVIDVSGDNVTVTVMGYEAARDRAKELGGVLVGTDGKPLRYVDFNNWPKGKILIPKTNDFDGKHDVPVAPNGRQMFIPRGQDCEVAEPFIMALMEARGTDYTQEENGGAMIPTEVQRHSLIVKRLPEYTILVPREKVAQAA
ncbi:hypothetical protein [Thalassobaculum sp.]|uniref:hypothetical protein n=1 Tax=Thalassobaculum sp. TaxID=2022740 RepID=UPI0032EAF7B1